MPRATKAANLPDAEARTAIREDLGRTILVEAGAGSGKTTMLVDRILALLLDGGAAPESVAAVTFTRKAASQLRRKFQAALEDAASNGVDRQRRARADDALAALDRITIGTIDAFCALLLGERPLEAGIDPAALKVEMQEAALFRDRSFREFVAARADSGGEVTDLLALGVRMNELEESFELFAEYPDVVPVVADPLALPDFAAIRKETEGFLRRAIPLVPEEPGAAGRDDLQTRLLEAKDLLELPDFGTPPGFARLLRTLRPSGGVTQYKWPDKAEAKRLGREFDALRQDVVKPALAEWQIALHERIYAVLRPALAHVAARRAGRGPFTYADLLLATRDLLRDHAPVRRAFAERFTRLLVDEFQDTDPLQAEILLYLAGTDTEEKDAARLVPRPGSLFVVGDPKQSIYRFRRADIASYVAFRDALTASGGRVVELTSNFRAVPALTQAANDVFRGLLPVEADERQAKFAKLDAVRPDPGPSGGAFRLPSSPERNAEDVARFVRWAVDEGWPVASEGPVRGARFADFLVLTRGRDHIGEYARALEAVGAPVDVSGSRSLAISRGLQELRPLLAAVQDPDDSVSVAAFLSGPLCGVDDDALHSYRRLGGRFSYLVPPPEGADPRLTRGLALLADSRRDVRALPAGAALGRIVERLGEVARLAAGPEGRTASGNLLKVLALARRMSGNGLAFRDVVGRLAEDTPALDLEEMSVEPVGSEAVRLMNLHRAKGLEAPIVVLAEIGGPGKTPAPKRHVARGRAGSRGWFTAGYYTHPEGRSPQWTVTAVPPDWENRKGIEIAFEEAERLRLLYVAATRARDTLVVSLSGSKPEKGHWSPLRSVLRDLPPSALTWAAPAPQKTPPLASRLPGARREIAAARERAAAPTYGVVTVTALAKREGPRAPSPAGEARGTAWGRVLHQILEAAMRNPQVEMRPLAVNLMRDEEVAPDLLDEVLRVANSVTSSDLWARARKAPRRYVEVPFEMVVPSRDLRLADGPAETLLKGAMDLVFEEEGVWHIVDWKSDAVGDLAALVAHYAPQVGHYRRAWETLTGRKAKAGLFFMDNGELVWLGEEGKEGEEKISLKVRGTEPRQGTLFGE